MADRSKVFLALPTSDGSRLNATALVGLPHGVHAFECAMSLLTGAFNACWAAALTLRDRGGCDRFVMLHSDVIPTTPQWLDALLDEMDKHRAQVLSVIIPLKDGRGLTSTGVEDPNDEWTVRRLSMTEAYRLPETGSKADLVVNTGLMAVDFTEPWVEKVCFHIRDKIERVGGRWAPRIIPEDWDFSRQCRALGVKLWATRKVLVEHAGRAAYPNDCAWGTEKTDEQWRAEQRIVRP